MKFQQIINIVGILLITYLCIQLAQVRMGLNEANKKLENALIMPKVEPLYTGDPYLKLEGE